MAEPEINGEISFSEILDGIPEETFIVNAILEPACDATFCENFNDYAFQKLPTFRDNFNYPTQSSADANWSSSDLPQIRVNAQTEVIDYDWTQNGTIEAMSFDLGADTVSKEKWILRFKFVLNSFTKADASPNLPFIGLATINSSSTTMDGDGIGFQVEVRTVEPVDFNLQHRDDATNNKDLVGNIGGSVLINVSTGTFYVEVRRESSTKAVCDVYSDAQFTTLLGSGSITMDDLTSDLRYILIAGRDNSGMNLLDGTIDDLEFWNGGQQGDRTFEDNFKQKTVTFTDDFSTPANFTTFGTDVFIAGGVLSALDDSDGTNHSAIHVLPTPLSDTKWVMRFRLTPTTLTAITAPPFESVIHIGAFDADHVVGTATPQDMIAFTLREGVGGSFYDLRDTDGAPPNVTPPDASSVDTPMVGITRFIELARTSATTYQAKLFLDPQYTDLIDTITGTCSATTDVMPFIGVKTNMQVEATAVASCDIDDLQVWNGVSSITDWILGGGTDVAYNTTPSQVDFDIPSGVDRDEFIAHDLQSSLGVNASDENWTLRFKLNTDSITQGASEEASSLFVGLDTNLDPTASLTHDLILLRISIDQGGAGPQFGAISSSLFRDGGGYFTGGTGGATQFPIAWSTGTRYVEVKRLSPTLMEVTLYTDANFTEVETNSSGVPLTVQDTITSTITDLRYIRVTTNSSAVANDSPWDGSVDDIEFYNGVSVSKSPVHETKDFEDTFLADNWADAGTDVLVNTTTQVIDWDAGDVTTNHATAFDLGVGNVSDSEWTLRAKVTINNVVAGTNPNTNRIYLGLFDSDQSVDSNTAQDGIYIGFIRGSVANQIAPFAENGAVLDSLGITPAFTEQMTSGDIFYVEIKRVTSTKVRMSLFSDADYSQLIQTVSNDFDVPAGISGLRYIKVINRSTNISQDSTLDGTIDDVQFWNKQNALDHENKWGNTEV